MSEDTVAKLANVVRDSLRSSTPGPWAALHVVALVAASFALDIADNDKAKAGDVLDSFGRDLADDVRNAKITLYVGPTIQ